MPSEELRLQLAAMVAKYRQMELDGMRVLPHSRDIQRPLSKPRIRVKAISRRRSLSSTAEAGGAGE